MTGTSLDPKWCLERRESSGQLVWRKESPESKVRFRYDVEVLEFEKQPHEHDAFFDEDLTASNLSQKIVIYIAAVAVFLVLPWYVYGKVGTF